ncbi:MAG: hypothetical protein AABX17_02470 [Nanoarchaeota archaeon]
MVEDLDLLDVNNPQNIGLGFLVYDLDGNGHLSEDFLNSPLGRYCEEELRREKTCRNFI